MSIWGSLLGGVIGFSFGGPFGALLGSFLGGKISKLSSSKKISGQQNAAEDRRAKRTQRTPREDARRGRVRATGRFWRP